jgi:carbonic anhydrase
LFTNPSLTRRRLVAGLAGAGAGIGPLAAQAQVGPLGGGPVVPDASRPALPSSARRTLSRLLVGNQRFRTGRSQHPRISPDYRRSLASGQRPIAEFFGCVDSRVPDEIITDQGLGDLLTIRTAGHVIDGAALGSLEFGVAELGIGLVVVLGHERCGAVQAAISTIDGGGTAEGAIQTLVDGIRPAVLATEGITDPVRRLNTAVGLHTTFTVRRLLAESEILATAVHEGRLGIVAARYDLDTGAIVRA